MFFKVWLESVETTPIVFLDLDGTLLHSIERGWLKDTKSNKNYHKILVPGKPPYENVQEIKIDGEIRHIFPRPGLVTFLYELSKIAEIHILTHSGGNYAEKCIKVLGLDKYISDIFHTGQQKPGSLGKKFHLDKRSWVLVDNLGIDTIEIINKFRILGLNSDNSSPKKEVDKILLQAHDKFVKVKEWVPTVKEFKDFDLWKALPEIKNKLGIELEMG